MDAEYDILIVGGGHGGAQSAVALRQRKFSGSIAIISEEPELPYERPPLSKDYLAGEKTFERMLLRPEAFWNERAIALLLNQRVVAIDPQRSEVKTHSGQTLRYGKLIWAAGGHARRLSCSGNALTGVHSVRSRADVDRLKSELASASAAVVIGGGYIGLESAAVLNKLGKRVTVLEALDRVLARVAGEQLSRFYEAQHRAHGVDVRLKVQVECIEARDGGAAGVRLASGELIPAEIVIVGIGIVPAVQPLLDAGAAGGNGVQVDEFCATSLPGIYAVGDCALHVNRFAAGRLVRVESVQNAADMALVVAKALTGAPEPYRAVPWFWSNQYDLRLQTVGISLEHDQTVIRGDPTGGHFSVVYLRGGRVVALDCVNASKDYVQGRALVMEGAQVNAEVLADPGIALNQNQRERAV